jgi:PilZ domain
MLDVCVTHISLQREIARTMPQACPFKPGGLLLLCSQRMAIGTELEMTALFTIGYELTSFDVDASVVWKGLQTEAEFRGFKYGVKFIRMTEREKVKLRYFLRAHMSVCLSLIPCNGPEEILLL